MKIIAAITLTLNSVESKPQEDVFHTDDSFFNGPSTERRYKDLHAITLHYNPTFDHRKQWYYGKVWFNFVFFIWEKNTIFQI